MFSVKQFPCTERARSAGSPLDPSQTFFRRERLLGMGPTGIAFVSYWEWVKLIGTAFLISCSTTAAAFALWLWWLADPPGSPPMAQHGPAAILRPAGPNASH